MSLIKNTLSNLSSIYKKKDDEMPKTGFWDSKAGNALVSAQKFMESPSSRVNLGNNLQYGSFKRVTPEDTALQKLGKGVYNTADLLGKTIYNVGKGAAESILTEPLKVSTDIGRGVGSLINKDYNFDTSSSPVNFGRDIYSMARGDIKPFSTVGNYGPGKTNFPVIGKLPEFGLSESPAAKQTQLLLRSLEPIFAAQGIQPENLPKVAGYLGGAGVLGGGISALTGGGFEEGALGTMQNVSPKAATTIGFNQMTNPFIEPSKKILGTTLPQKSALNVLQGIGLSDLQGVENDAASILIDALFPVGEVALKGAFKTSDQALRAGKASILEAMGKKLRTSKGSYTTYDKYIKGTRAYFKNNDNKLMGAMAGLETYQDEDGNYKVRFNKNKALLGLGVTFGGVKAVDSLDDILRDINPAPIKESLSEFSASDVDRAVTESVLREDLSASKPLKEAWNNMLNPLKNAADNVREPLINWRNKSISSKVNANAEVMKFADIDPEEGWKIVRYIQNPTKETASRLNLDVAKNQENIKNISLKFDELYNRSKSLGFDVDYQNNYINQRWKQNVKEIETKMSAGKSPYFVKEKGIPSYEEGIKMGLEPKYTHPAALIGDYIFNMEKAVANKELVNSLMKSGHVLPSNMAPSGWKYLDIPGFPKSRSGVGTISDYKADPANAKAINEAFNLSNESIWKETANFSKTLQTLQTAGGVGKANSFTLSQVIKELTAGRIKSPLQAFFTGKKGYNKFMDAKSDIVKKAGTVGLDFSGKTSYSKLENVFKDKTLKDKAGDAFEAGFEEGTFQRFMPMLGINLFEDSYNNFIKNGYDEKTAIEMAGKTVKNFQGVTDNFTRPKDVENIISTLFFAPRFRESMINSWVNNIKAFLPENIKSPEYKYNRQFMAGAVLTGIIYEFLNKKITGHWMHENKEGKGTSLEIPSGQAGRSIYVPILPSISTLPRRAVEVGTKLASGDLAGAANRAGTLMSTPVSVGTDLLTNETFYGSPIAQESDTVGQKWAKNIGYGLSSIAPSYISEPIEVAQGRKTVGEAALGVMELPAYPSRSTDTSHLYGKQNSIYKEIYEMNPDSAKAYAQAIKAKNSISKDIKKDRPLTDKTLRLLSESSAEGLNDAYGYKTYLTEPPKDSINQKIWIKSVESEARSAWREEDLPQEIRAKMVSDMGMKPAEVELDVVANMGSNLEKAAWIQDKLETIPAKNQMEFLSLLSTYKTMSGKYALTKGVAEELGIAGAYSALSAGKPSSSSSSGSKAKIKSTSSSTKSAKTSGAFSQPIKLAPYMQNMKKPSLSVDLDKLRKGEI